MPEACQASTSMPGTRRLSGRLVALPFLLAAFAFAASACGDESAVNGERPAPPAAAPAVDGSIKPSPAPALTTAPGAGATAQVTRVIDGDTIEVRLDGRTATIRYIGIDTPETRHPTVAVECYGREAADANRRLVEGKKVTLEKDVSEADQFSRLLRYVYADGQMVNESLVREGYAVASAFPPDVREQAPLSRRRERGSHRWAGPLARLRRARYSG